MVAAGAEGYCNRYRNGWGTSIAAHRAAVDEARRRKRHAVTPASQMSAPLPLPKFAWPITLVRPALTFLLPGYILQHLCGARRWLVLESSAVQRCKLISAKSPRPATLLEASFECTTHVPHSSV